MQSPLAFALYQPEIPHNTGMLIRLSACFQVPLYLIEPLGFLWDMQKLKRSSLDYLPHANVQRVPSWKDFLTRFSPHRIILLTPQGSQDLYDFTFHPQDVLLFGRESDGVPDHVADQCYAQLRIPMSIHCRSLNLALSASIVLGEALRQMRLPRDASELGA